MAEKELKRKRRPQTVTPAAERARGAPTPQAAPDRASQQLGREVGAYYAAGPAYGLALAAEAPQEEDGAQTDARAEAHLRGAAPGEPLPAALRRRYEAVLGHDLGAVRLHRGIAAERAAGDLQARAFTHRNHIWLGPRADPADARVMAHELTHVIQQGHAPALPHRMAVTLPQRAANTPMHGGQAAARPAAAAGGGAVQRIDIWGAARRVGGAVASGVRAVGGAVVDVAGDLLSMGRDALLAIVRRIAPDFLPLFEGDGIAGFLRRLIQRGLRSLFDGLMSPLRGMLSIGNLGARISQAMSWISTIAGQLANNDCSGILAAARRVRAFFSSALKPVIDRIKSISDRVSGFFRSIWEGVGAPIMDVLRRIGGEIWQSLRGFVRDLGRTIRRVRDALGSAWQRVKGWFGIRAEEGEEEGGGLWGWIREKATAIGRSISETVRPILGPLRQAGGVLLLLVPGGQIAAVMLLWPDLRRAFDWISQRWQDLNLIPRARAFLANTVLPALINAAESVAQAFLRGADWLLGLLDRIAGALANAMRAATGMFAPLGRLIGYARQQFHRLVTWARSGLRYVSRNFRSLMQRLIRFLQPILDALHQLILIAVNPFGIVGFLMGTLWRMIPNCLKGPIIDFILEVIIGILRVLPPMPQLGLIWPLIKSAMLGFLEQVLSFSLQRKVNVSNKVARIISGMSPSFLFGYLRGLALGVWRGITAPFQAIAAIFELPAQIQAFLSNLGLSLCELVEKIRCFAATLVGRVFGSLDDILRALGELLEDPARILELIRCAIEGALGAARTLGQTIANQMMAILEGPDDAIGERLGEITGQALLRAVITYFTAGAGAGIGIIQDISRALSTVGRAIRQVVQLLRGLLGRLVSLVRGLASRFAGAVARGGRSVLGRLGGFFRRVAAWFGRLFRRLGASFRRRFGLSAQQRVMWLEFRGAVRGALASYQQSGITRGRLRGVYRGVLNRFRPVAKRPAFITKHGPHWRVWVRRVKSIIPRRVGRVLLDRDTRWRAGRKAVLAAIRGLKRRPGNISTAEINRALQRVRRRYRYTSLSAQFDTVHNIFRIQGGMSPGGPLASTTPKIEDPNEFSTTSGGATIDNLVFRRLRRSSASGNPTHWDAVRKIKSPPSYADEATSYVKGHLIAGWFASGSSNNLTPIKRSTNRNMEVAVEAPLKNKLKTWARFVWWNSRGRARELNVYRYTVTKVGTAGQQPPLRDYISGGRRARVREEALLAEKIRMRIVKKEYRPGSKQWVNAGAPGGGLPSSHDEDNVPSYPPGKIKRD